MRGARSLTLKSLAQKAPLYAAEIAFALRAPATARQSLGLMRRTAAFHYRNWRKARPDPRPPYSLELVVGGYGATVSLRPHEDDLGILYEIFTRDTYMLSPSVLPPEGVRTIVDAGANIGLAALYLAQRYPQATIYSIEPHPENFELLVANTARERRIVPLQACITAAPRQQVFIGTTGRASCYKMNTQGRGVSVRGMSVAELCDEHGIDRIDLMKIDVEGAEREIFGDGSFLPKVGAVVAELHGDYDLERFNADLARWGFEARVNPCALDPKIYVAGRT